jgi:hypothetical protein
MEKASREGTEMRIHEEAHDLFKAIRDILRPPKRGEEEQFPELKSDVKAFLIDKNGKDEIDDCIRSLILVTAVEDTSLAEVQDTAETKALNRSGENWDPHYTGSMLVTRIIIQIAPHLTLEIVTTPTFNVFRGRLHLVWR